MSLEPDDFWQHHSPVFLEMAFRTDRQESIAHCDGHGKNVGDCGDIVELFINIEGDTIGYASYMSTGCLNTNACANAILTLIEGKKIAQAWQVTPDIVAEFLQTLPEDHFHCAELSVGALYLALADAAKIQRSPWKKMYR